MIKRVDVSGFGESAVKLTLEEERSGLLSVSNLKFDKVVENERKRVMLWLKGKFSRLRYEELEEVYDDGCLVLWEKMMDKDFKLRENCIVGYLMRVCWNIGMHYLRKVNDDGESLDRIMERGFGVSKYDGIGKEEMFAAMEEKVKEEERYAMLERVLSKLKEVDRMILQSYYLDGYKMEEIAKRIGYKNGNSVKSKKKTVLTRIKKMLEGADFKNLPAAA